ncbi:MAG: hypothetical protein ABEH65_04055 [Halobacteriales archaeon]
MSAIEEKRIFAERIGRTVAFVAAGLGIATVGIADDRVGEVRIDRRCTPNDIAAGDQCVAVATDTELLYWTADKDTDGESTTEPTDGVEFTALDGPDATVVGFASNRLRVADADGTIHAETDDGWRTIGAVDGTVTAIDGDLVATEAGVYRIADGLQHVGLTGVRDISTTGVPRAATAEGLFTLGNGWLETLAGDFRVVAASSDGDHAHAAAAETVYATTDGDWTVVDIPIDAPVADIAYGETSCVVTNDGTLALPGETGWRTYPLGLLDVTGIAIP